MIGTLGRKPSEDANIVDHELPVFGYHAGFTWTAKALIRHVPQGRNV